MDAYEMNPLRGRIAAVLTVSKPQDQAMFRLENPGGMVRGYGLAASQLRRLCDKNVSLTVMVDKITIDGGYMMACMVDKIIFASFTVVGSIDVVTQILNFNHFLESENIDIELHTTEQYERTLTLLGENIEEGQEKFREELNEIRQLFKGFVKHMCFSLGTEQVAADEHWYGQQTVEKDLIGRTNTNDEAIPSLMEDREVVSVRYMQRKQLIDRSTGGAAESANRLLLRW